MDTKVDFSLLLKKQSYTSFEDMMVDKYFFALHLTEAAHVTHFKVPVIGLLSGTPVMALW